eukprot:scaffold10005_cov87-Phaeocystis_antarctica.AAC.1
MAGAASAAVGVAATAAGASTTGAATALLVLPGGVVAETPTRTGLVLRPLRSHCLPVAFPTRLLPRWGSPRLGPLLAPLPPPPALSVVTPA